MVYPLMMVAVIPNTMVMIICAKFDASADDMTRLKVEEAKMGEGNK